jgi:hypothetical protein
MGGARTAVAAVIAAAICALALSACGGGDDSAGSTASTQAATTATTAEATSPTTSGGQSPAEPPAVKETPEEAEAHETPKQGERSAAFAVPGGDNSIQTYGDEGDGTEREEANESITALNKALAGGSWNVVCSKYLSKKNLEQLQMLTKAQPKLSGLSCAAMMGKLNVSTPQTKSPSAPKGGIASFRIEGDTGFAIYRGNDGKGYAYPLTLEDGVWKLTALGPTPITP